MTIVYSTAAKAARMTAVQALIDAGSTFGRLEIGTAMMGTILVAIALQKPSASVSGAVLTVLGAPLSANASAAGTASAARIVDSDGNVVIGSLTVGVSTGDIRVDAVAVAIGQAVSVSSAVITHAA